MIAGLGIWSHSLAALLFAGVGLWQAQHWQNRAARAVIVACMSMAVWAGTVAVTDVSAPIAQLGESMRNLAWLSFLYALLRRGGTEHRALGGLYGVLGFVVTTTAATNLLMVLDPIPDPFNPSILLALFVLRMVFAVGALVALHNLYTATAAGARAGVGLPLAALGALWAVDLTFYALSWKTGGWGSDVAAVRGPVALVLAPLVALAAQRNTGWSIRLSRTVAFRSIGLVAALAYLGLVIALATALDAISGSAAQIVMPMILIAAALLVAIGIASPQARAWAKVMLSKHLFAHRYDYRAEWLRFTDTLGIPGPGGAPLDSRVVKAIADIVESPGGLLLVPGASGLSAGARWQWEGLVPPLDTGCDALTAILRQGRIVELDALRSDSGNPEEMALVPEWIAGDPAAWAVVPLVHFDRLTGAVLLERPVAARAFDWEDFDLLRLAGRQVASYLAEAQSQEALSDAARFDEFNRRFAFIMHDIKNLVSQLTLVTRNAERHADKPEFRADMVATLQSSTARMNDLLARLSQHNKARAEDPRTVDLRGIASAVAARHRLEHPVVVAGDGGSFALAEPARLEQALSHLVQNAVDASPAAEPVTLTMVRRGDEAGIEIVDRGPGMTADFVRGSLYRPFTSTKAGGFGIGAYEARALVSAMGGRIGIVTAPGEGSRFTIWLPNAEPVSTRMVA